MSRYATYPHLWSPTEETQLFCVRVPQSIGQLTRMQYLRLMEQRLQGLIQAWTQDYSQTDAHQLMAQTILQFNPASEAPSLKLATVEWSQMWAETLIHYNETFWARSTIDQEAFPAVPFSPETAPFDAIQAIHDTTTLETWLNELRIV